ncbi:MAG: class I SAM-dependent methyltransferase [Nocardioidaceae bacterium]|nr:class I SAM-dependent methyltransferase [Nocardioidaceae bacterium]
MSGTAATATSPVCPACGAARPRLGPTSRQTGSVVAACTRCGCHWLTNPSPADQIAEHYESDREAYAAWADAKRQGTLESAYVAALDRLEELIRSPGRTLFDVGAGAGEFLDVARARGFEPQGNELSPGAAEMTKERTGIDLYLGDLSVVEGSDLFDAVTMWCVLAHVHEPDDLLEHAFRLLKPGGVLYLQTPRWSAMDTAGLAAARISGGRATRVLDRRVNDAHMVLNSSKGLTAQARRAGFEVVEARPLARYSMKTEAYLRSLGLPERAGRAAARGLDLAVDRNLFFRNILDLYARKPLS